MAPVTPVAELQGHILDVGGLVLATALTAAALHEFDGYVLRRPYHLLVLTDRHVCRNNVRLHRTDQIDLVDRCTVDGLPVTSPTRTLIELARVLNREQLASCLDSALRDGLVSEDSVHRRIVALRSSGRHGLPALLDVLVGNEVTRGGQSWLEREYLKLLNVAGLPRPDTQAVLTKVGNRLVRVDCRFVGSRVVVELLGYRYHRTRAQMTSDAARLNALLADGFLPYQFTYDQVTRTPDDVIATTSLALGAG